MKACRRIMFYSETLNDACHKAKAVADQDGITVLFWYDGHMVRADPGDSIELVQAAARTAITRDAWMVSAVVGEIRLRQTSIIVRAVAGWRFAVEAGGDLTSETYATAGEAKAAAYQLCLSLIEMGMAP